MRVASIIWKIPLEVNDLTKVNYVRNQGNLAKSFTEIFDYPMDPTIKKTILTYAQNKTHQPKTNNKQI